MVLKRSEEISRAIMEIDELLGHGSNEAILVPCELKVALR